MNRSGMQWNQQSLSSERQLALVKQSLEHNPFFLDTSKVPALPVEILTALQKAITSISGYPPATHGGREMNALHIVDYRRRGSHGAQCTLLFDVTIQGRRQLCRNEPTSNCNYEALATAVVTKAIAHMLNAMNSSQHLRHQASALAFAEQRAAVSA